ncbi:hypothetical protein EB75_02015 [Mycobacterium sp. ST-F2]|nr:hypothetical protein EB75_02015 [Mycobacterium sp. ST-F2]
MAAMAAPAVRYERRLTGQDTDSIPCVAAFDDSSTVSGSNVCCGRAPLHGEHRSGTLGDTDNSCLQSQRAWMLIAATEELRSMDA